MSETLREEEGGQQVAEEEDAHDEPDQVLRADSWAHSRSTALRMRREMTKNAIVRTT
jgi:hypothetical protein